jgi:hypothetical protein
MTPQPNRIISAAEAARIWTQYGFTSPDDLVLEDLALALGIVVMDGRLDSCAARLVRSGGRGLVRVSDAIREPGRRRFAIAHEIGHWLLHEKVSHLLACTDADLLASYKSSPLEVEASIFAGNLLMPEHLFAPAAANKPPTATLIKALAAQFDTTLTATALRYVETTDDYCVFVVSENNRIRWWRASRAFGDHELWIDNRTALPRHSAAACFFRGETVPARPQRVDLRDWFGDDLPGISSDTVIEQAMPLSAYGQVLSLIWLP